MTERENLVELMARALYECDPINDKSGAPMTWADFSERDLYGTVGNMRDDCRAALAALEAAGVRLVPVEATEEMKVYARQRPERKRSSDKHIHDVYGDVYRAMLAASPYAPEGTRND